MPIYEYGCYTCKKRVNIFWKSFSAAQQGTPVCPRCGGTNIKRLVSKVAFVRSEESRLETMSDPSTMAGFDEEDPKSLAKWMRRMGNEVGEDLGPEFGEVVDRLQSGQSPEDIENDMPDLAKNIPGSSSDDDWLG